MEFKGTPGPWVKQLHARGVAERFADGTPVYDVVAPSGVVAYTVGEEEGDLIAAAPDLLAALAPLVELWEDAEWTYEDAYYRFLKGGASVKWNAAKAAIAKALGEPA